MTQPVPVKPVSEMSIAELDEEHLELRARIHYRRERMAQQPLSKSHCKKLLALCNKLYGVEKIE